jgi:hypothetical protein
VPQQNKKMREPEAKGKTIGLKSGKMLGRRRTKAVDERKIKKPTL